MMQSLVLSALKSILKNPDIKLSIFKAIDKAVKDTTTPIDDQAAIMFKSFYETLVGAL